VNWFSSAWHAVTHPGQLLSDGEHLLGEVADKGAYALGSGLNHVGLGSVGQWVEHLGDEAAGALDPELQLGHAGILTGAADIVKVVRDVNPMDPWNMAHPAEYLAGVSALGAGLVNDVVNPQDLASGEHP